MRRPNQDQAQDDSRSTGQTSEQILDSIIALDDLYQEGEIGEKEYSKKRQELKAKLAALEDEKI